MVSQGAQTNGGLMYNGTGRRLTKSFSETPGGRFDTTDDLDRKLICDQ